MQRATVNSIFSEYAGEYIRRFRPSDFVIKIIRAMIDCRTDALGGHIQRCDSCGNEIILYNSCRDRHCPQCQFMKKEKWIEDRKNEVLPYQYFHCVFTLPDSLNPIVAGNRKMIYKLLFDKVRDTLLSVAEEDKYFGARIGFFSILHTWGQKLNLHPHIHCIIPGGGYVEKKDKWKSCSKDYFIPVEVLMMRFRSLFLVGIKMLHKSGKLKLENTKFQNKKDFQELIDRLFRTDWIVYIKESFQNPDSVIGYLAKYTHRIAISNHRIISVQDRIVRFSYKDYADGNSKKVLELEVMQFIRRFLTHIVPRRFVRIRYYGLLSNSTKTKQVSRCREYYDIKEKKRISKTWQEFYRDITGTDITVCCCCGKGRMALAGVIPPQRDRAGP